MSPHMVVVTELKINPIFTDTVKSAEVFNDFVTLRNRFSEVCWSF